MPAPRSPAAGATAQADLTATLLTAWAYAGSKDGKRALATVDQLKSERAFNQFREYHAALIADVVGNPAEAEKRFKAAYEGERNTLQVVDAYAPLPGQARPQGRSAGDLQGLRRSRCRAIPIVRAAMKTLKAGKPLPPIVTSAQDGAAELLYGLGVVGNTQGRRTDGDHLPAPRPRSQARSSARARHPRRRLRAPEAI